MNCLLRVLKNQRQIIIGKKPHSWRAFKIIFFLFFLMRKKKKTKTLSRRKRHIVQCYPHTSPYWECAICRLHVKTFCLLLYLFINTNNFEHGSSRHAYDSVQQQQLNRKLCAPREREKKKKKQILLTEKCCNGHSRVW